mmetsp:Transcript_1418/g.3273  ORF Transcript_1418/g.3273 Transcript_1418/m.3273 type:complete len:215 (-) Transcript_1418:128-772(-)
MFITPTVSPLETRSTSSSALPLNSALPPAAPIAPPPPPARAFAFVPTPPLAGAVSASPLSLLFFFLRCFRDAFSFELSSVPPSPPGAPAVAGAGVASGPLIAFSGRVILACTSFPSSEALVVAESPGSVTARPLPLLRPRFASALAPESAAFVAAESDAGPFATAAVPCRLAGSLPEPAGRAAFSFPPGPSPETAPPPLPPRGFLLFLPRDGAG